MKCTWRILAAGMATCIVSAIPAPAQQLKASHAPSITQPAAAVAPQTAVVARVNGVPLTQAALDAELKRIFPSYAMHGGVPKEYEAEIRTKALNNLINTELTYQEAVRRKLPIPAAEWQQRMREIRADYGSQKEFDAAMQQYFGSRKAFEEKLRHDMLLDRIWLLEVKNKSRVSDAEVRSFYNKNKGMFVEPEALSVQTVSTLYRNDAGAAEKAAARQRAEKILPQAKAATSYEQFGRLAEKVSEDDWRVMMGEHKRVQRNQAGPELQPAFAMKPGEISGLFESPLGFHILRLNRRDPSRQLSFAEVRSSIRGMLEKERLNRRSKEFHESLWKTAKVEGL